jgi:hypothetical protein
MGWHPKNGNFTLMNTSKLRLSEEELRLVMDPGFILTKNAIIEKVYALFGLLAEDFRGKIDLPEEVAVVSPKISKGENYLGLPYVMLDYPRFFSTENVMAVRCFFWWGNFFSITLHLKGRYREMASDVIIRQYSFLSAHGYSIAISEAEWQHHFGEDNYREINSMDANEFRLCMAGLPHLKIARNFPLSSWEDMRQQFVTAYGELGGLIAQPVK